MPILFVLALIILSLAPHPREVNALLFLGAGIGVLAIIIIPFMWHYRYAKVVDAVSGRPNNLFLYFIILTVFGATIVWYAIVQSILNQLNQHPAQAQPSPQPLPPVSISQ